MGKFEFRGSGFGYLWLLIWTSLLSIITLGLFFPWAYSAQQRWIASNTYINGRQLIFLGSGISLLGHWLLIMILTIVTLGIYLPWAYCHLKRWETDNLAFSDELPSLQQGLMIDSNTEVAATKERTMASKILCPHCNAPVEADWKFCPDCAKQL